MKKFFIIIPTLIILSACSDTKQKADAGTETRNTTEANSSTQSTDNNAADESMKVWLQQKEWKAENGGAPITLMKLYADGRCVYSTGTDTWSYSEGSFGLHLGGAKRATVKWPVKKIDDKSFSLYVEPTQKTYTYTFVSDLKN